MPNIIRVAIPVDPRTDLIYVRAFKELLEALEATGAGENAYTAGQYRHLAQATIGLQERPQNLGNYLKFWMDKWAANELTPEDLGRMNWIARMLQ